MKISMPKIRFEKSNSLTVGLLFVIAALENFGYLVPATDVFINPIKYSDIGFLLALIWSVCVILKTGLRFQKRREQFWMPALYFGVIILSGTVASKLYGQGMIYTFIRNRRIMLGIILFYAIITALRYGLIKKKDVITIIFIQASAELCIDFLQYVLADYVTFTYYDIGERYNGARVRAAYLLPLIMGYFALGNYIKGWNKAVNILGAFCAFFLLAGICKHRTPTIIVLVTIAFAFLLWKKNISKKLVLGTILAFISIPILLNLQIVQDTIRTTLSQDANVNSLIIRNRAKAYYFERLKLSPFLGFGEPYSSFTEATAASGNRLGYIREDNGVFGFLYSHGILGAVWLVLLFVGIWRRAVAMYRNKNEYVYILYFAFETLNLYMGMHWYYDYQYPFMIMLALLEFDYIELINKKKNSILRLDKRIPIVSSEESY